MRPTQFLRNAVESTIQVHIMNSTVETNETIVGTFAKHLVSDHHLEGEMQRHLVVDIWCLGKCHDVAPAVIWKGKYVCLTCGTHQDL